MKLYDENGRLSDQQVREYLGQKALFFATLAGYSRTPNTSRVEFDERRLAVIRRAREVLDIHLAILDTPLDADSGNPEQRDADKEHRSGVDVNRVDFYSEDGGPYRTAISRDEEEGPDEGSDNIDLSEPSPFTDDSEGPTVDEIYSYSDAAAKLRRDMSAAQSILRAAEEDKALTIGSLSRLHSLISSVRANSYVERDLVGYDPFNDRTITTKKGTRPVTGDDTLDVTRALLGLTGELLEPTEGVGILAQQGLSITLGKDFYNDLLSADILDKGRYNVLRNGKESNLISRTEKDAVDNGEVFADMMVRNSKRLEQAAWDQWQAVKGVFGDDEGIAMLSNIQVVYQKTLAKLSRALPDLEKDLASRQSELRMMVTGIGMQEGVDYSSSPDVDITLKDIDDFLIRNDVLESMDLRIEDSPSFRKAANEYNAAYNDFAARKQDFYSAVSFLADPMNANRLGSLQLFASFSTKGQKQDFDRALNDSHEVSAPVPDNPLELIAARSGFMNDVSSSVRIHRSAEEQEVGPVSRRELRILAQMNAVERRIGESDNYTRLMELVESIDFDEMEERIDAFCSQPELAPFFRSADRAEMADFYRNMASHVKEYADSYQQSAERLAQAGSALNAEIRAGLARTQVEFVSRSADLSEEDKEALARRFEHRALYATYEKNLHKDRILNSTDADVAVSNNLKAEYGNVSSLVYGSACPMSLKECDMLISRNTLENAPGTIQMLATGMKAMSMDLDGVSQLDEKEVATVRANLESGSQGYYESLKAGAQRSLEDAQTRLSRHSSERDAIAVFNPDVQAEFGYEARRVFESFVSDDADRQKDFGRLQDLLRGLVDNNPAEAENVKKVNAYLLREMMDEGNPFVKEAVERGLVDVDTHYTLHDVRPIVDTLMIAGEANKRILAEFRATGDHTKLKRIPHPDTRDKNRYENLVITSYNGLYQEERMEELGRLVARDREDVRLAKNRLADIASVTPRACSWGDISTRAIADGQVDDARVEYLRQRTREAEGMAQRERGFEILRETANVEFGRQDGYISNAQDFYNRVVDTLNASERDKVTAAERRNRLEAVIRNRDEDYALPVKELLRQEVASNGRYPVTAKTVAGMSPESVLQRFSLSVLPTTEYPMAAFKMTTKGMDGGKDRSMNDYVNIKELYAEVKRQSVYTYPINQGYQTLREKGLETRHKKRSVAEREAAMTSYGKTLWETRSAGKAIDQKLDAFAVRNLPSDREHQEEFRRILASRNGINQELVASMRMTPSKLTGNTVVSIPGEVLERCSKVDQLAFKAAIPDIKFQKDGRSVNLDIVSGESASRRMVEAINLSAKGQEKSRTRSTGIAF